MFCFLKSRPVYNRIPNFKGASRAAANLTEQLQEFRDARTIKVNPDKPQEEVRFKVQYLFQAFWNMVLVYRGLIFCAFWVRRRKSSIFFVRTLRDFAQKSLLRLSIRIVMESQLSKLWWMPNSVRIGFGPAMKTGTSRGFKLYPATYSWVSSQYPFTVD